MLIRVHRKGIVVLPKAIRERLGIDEGTILEVEIRGREIVLRPLDLWERVWGCAKGLGSAEEAELELDKEEAMDEQLDSKLE